MFFLVYVGTEMAVRIKDLIDKIKAISLMADGAVSFKSKCRATRANARFFWELLVDLEALEEDQANVLEEPLKVVEAVLVVAERTVESACQLGWFQEWLKTEEITFAVCELERRFMRAHKGTTMILSLSHLYIDQNT